MDEELEPPSLQGLGPRTNTDVIRRRILAEYELSGVDLPVVSLETVLDRDTTTPPSDFGASRIREGAAGRPRFRSFSGGDDAATKVRKESTRGGPGECAMRAGSSDKDEVRPTTSVSHHGTAPDRYHREHFMESMTILGEIPSSEFDGDGSFPDSDPSHPPRVASLASPVTATNCTREEEAMVACMNHQDLNSTFCQTGATPPSVGTGTVEEARTFDCGQFWYPPTDGINETDHKYVVSNLQMAEGFGDEDDSNRSLRAYSDVIPSRQGSRTDAHDAAAMYRDGMVPPRRRRRLFKGRSGFHGTVAACCVIHMVMVGVIIGLAVRRRTDDADSLGVANTAPEAGPQGPTTGSPFPDLEAEATEGPSWDAGSGGSTEIDAIPPPCVDSLEPSLTCYGLENEILVYFLSCDPRPGDWVAIYEASQNATALLEDDSLDWMFTCGDQDCSGVVSSEVVAFSQSPVIGGGTYRAHLIRDGPGPVYAAYASSGEFQVEDSAADCETM
jgi:hypothetical protein